MKNLRFVIICFLLFSFACVQNKDIETVKNSSLGLGLLVDNKYTVDNFVKEIAGIRGSIYWESFHPEKYKDNLNIVCVQITITRNTEKNNVILMQYLLNRETGFIQSGCLKVDGVGQSIVNFYAVLMEIGINNI
jgi:hypothetical protein